MVKAIEFFREVWQEMLRVTWPAKNETLGTSLMVFIMVLIASVFYTLVDMGVYNSVQFILSLGS